MPSPEPDTALNAAVQLFGPERGHQLLGCDWGTKVALPNDREVCIRQARQRMVLHGHAGGPLEPLELKLCLEHAMIIDLETDPHMGEAADA